MPTPEDAHYDEQHQAQEDWDAMVDSVTARREDDEPTEAQLQPEGGWSGGIADNH